MISITSNAPIIKAFHDKESAAIVIPEQFPDDFIRLIKSLASFLNAMEYWLYGGIVLEIEPSALCTYHSPSIWHCLHAGSFGTSRRPFRCLECLAEAPKGSTCKLSFLTETGGDRHRRRRHRGSATLEVLYVELQGVH